MDRRDPQSGRQATWSAVLLLGVALGAGVVPSGSPSDATAPGASVKVRHAMDVPNRMDRHAILIMIREYRRATSERWRVTLADAIYNESVRAGVDPLFVASIVAKESSFKSRIRSRSGAVGLMQLRPFVAKDVARRADVPWNGVDTLHSPELNVRLGISYYKELIERFDGDSRKALAAYNMGPTRLVRQLRSGSFEGSSYAAEIIDCYDRLQQERRDATTSA